MTLKASTAAAEFGAQVAAMLVLMARQTVLLQASKLEKAESLFLNLRSLLVAVDALAFGVLTFEWVTSCLLVIEVFNLPVLLGVARKTFATTAEFRTEVFKMLILMAG